MLEVAGLKKHFPLKGGRTIYAVDGVSFAVGEGETLGLVGESGSGKTTAGKCILKLIEPTEGRIVLRGVDLTPLSRDAMRPHRRAMQVVFQDPYSSLNSRHRSIRTPRRCTPPCRSRYRRRSARGSC